MRRRYWRSKESDKLGLREKVRESRTAPSERPLTENGLPALYQDQWAIITLEVTGHSLVSLVFEEGGKIRNDLIRLSHNRKL